MKKFEQPGSGLINNPLGTFHDIAGHVRSNGENIPGAVDVNKKVLGRR